MPRSPFSHHQVLIHLVLTHFVESGKLREGSLDEMNRGVQVAVGIWNIGMSITERHMVDAYSAPSYARKFFEKKVLPYFDLDDCLHHPNHLYLYAMIRTSRLPVETYGASMRKLADMTRERFLWISHELWVPEEIPEEILRKLKNPSFDILDEQASLDYVMRILKTGKLKDLESLTPWMREVQALVNHTTYEKLGYITSRFTMNIYEDMREVYEKDDVDIRRVMSVLTESHGELAVFLEMWQRSNEDYNTEMAEFFRAHAIKKKFEKKEISSELPPILHHMLDWYVMTLESDLQRRSPKQVITGMIVALSSLYESYPEKESKKSLSYTSLLPYESWIRKEYLDGYGWQSVQVDVRSWEYLFPGYFTGDMAMLFPSSADPSKLEKMMKKDGYACLEMMDEDI
jgi:hypothetical protein